MKVRAFLRLFAAGLVGILTLPLGMRRELAAAAAELAAAEGIRLPPALLAALMLVQPTVLLALAVLAGVHLAPRLGLRSHLAGAGGDGGPGGRPFRSEIGVAVGLGAAAAAAVMAADLAFRPWLGEAWSRLLAEAGGFDPLRTLSGILYGGVTEELMMRWGLLSLLAWGAHRLTRRPPRPPRPAVMWSAVVAAALAFGAGHLPAVAAEVPLTGPIVVRTIALNALGGIVFGWLFWRRSLEAAMVAHGCGHLVFAAAALAE